MVKSGASLVSISNRRYINTHTHLQELFWRLCGHNDRFLLFNVGILASLYNSLSVACCK